MIHTDQTNVMSPEEGSGEWEIGYATFGRGLINKGDCVRNPIITHEYDSMRVLG